MLRGYLYTAGSFCLLVGVAGLRSDPAQGVSGLAAGLALFLLAAINRWSMK